MPISLTVIFAFVIVSGITYSVLPVSEIIFFASSKLIAKSIPSTSGWSSNSVFSVAST